MLYTIMRVIITYIFLLTFTSTYGQKESEAIYGPNNKGHLHVIDSVFKLERGEDFELIIQSFSFEKIGGEIFIFSSSKDQLKARLFFQIYRDSSYAWKECPIKGSPKSLYESLSQYDLLHIPSQSEIKDSSIEKRDFPIYDGVSYVFKIRIKNESREFSYHCPKTLVSAFPHVPEFKIVSTLLNLVFSAFGFKDFVKC